MSDKIKVTQATRRALKNTNWLLLEKLLTLPLALTISILLARHLGAEGFGTYSYLLSLVYLVMPISTVGLNALVTKELVNRPQEHPQVLGASFLGRLFGGLFSCLLLAIYAFGFAQEYKWWIVLLAVAQVFSTFTLLDFWFQARTEVKYSVFARIVPLFLLFIARVLAVYLGASLETFVWLYGLELVMIAFAYLVLYKRRGGQVSTWRPRVADTKKLLSQSYLLVLSGFAAAVYLRIDIVMLEQLRSTEEVGLYAVASRISEIWYFIPAALITAFFPSLLALRKENMAAYHRKLQSVCNSLFLMSLVVILPVALFAEFFITLLFGQDFAPAAAVLMVHVFAGMFIFMRALLSKWLIAEHLLKYSLVTQGVGALVNVLLNLLLIPEFGMMGAAWATLISYASASYLALFFSSETRPMAIIMSRAVIYPITFPVSLLKQTRVSKTSKSR